MQMEAQERELYTGLIRFLMEQRGCDDTLKMTTAYLRAHHSSVTTLQFYLQSTYKREAICDCQVMSMLGFMLMP